MSLEAMLNSTAEVLAPSNSQDSTGANIETFALTGASFACNHQQLHPAGRSGAEEVGARGTLGIRVTHKCYCRPGPVVSEKCRLRIAGADYLITGIDPDVANAGQLMVIDLLEIRA